MHVACSVYAGASRVRGRRLCRAFSGQTALIPTGELRVLQPVFQHYGRCGRFSGRVVTMRVFEHNARLRELLEKPGHEGRVLVIDGGGSTRCALFGGTLAELARCGGWAGVVVNGCVRDVDDVNACAIGVRALASSPRKPGKEGATEMHVPVNVGGAVIHDGEWLDADSDGIIVCSKEIYA